jgi:hypothetical protein
MMAGRMDYFHPCISVRLDASALIMGVGIRSIYSYIW